MNRREIITAASALPLSGAVLADARTESIPDLFVELLREYQRRSAELDGRQRPISFADDAWLAEPLNELVATPPATARDFGAKIVTHAHLLGTSETGGASRAPGNSDKRGSPPGGVCGSGCRHRRIGRSAHVHASDHPPDGVRIRPLRKLHKLHVFHSIEIIGFFCGTWRGRGASIFHRPNHCGACKFHAHFIFHRISLIFQRRGTCGGCGGF